MSVWVDLGVFFLPECASVLAWFLDMSMCVSAWCLFGRECMYRCLSMRLWLYVLGISGWVSGCFSCVFVCVCLSVLGVSVASVSGCPSMSGCVFSEHWRHVSVYWMIVSFCAGILSSRGVSVSLGAEWVPVSLPHHSVGLATLVTTVSMTWMNVPPGPARMEVSALT